MDNALPGTQSYDFLKERWNGNFRQVHSLIPLIESMLKDKVVYYMLDFDTFPSPVVPHLWELICPIRIIVKRIQSDNI